MASEREELFSEIEDNLWSKRWPSGDPSVEEVEQAINAYLALNLDMLGQYPDLAASMDRAAFVSEMRDKYWKDRSVRKSVGHFIEDSDANVSWLPELDDAGKIDWYYWEQYYTYLHKKQHWSKDVCDSIGKDSYNILALTGDPNSPANFKKKGLVVGNVQSGKTANYLGLICRAADAGYKYIIVLAAITMLALDRLVARTKIGGQMRAVSMDKDAASLMGINVNKVISITFFIGGALAAVSGICYASAYPQVEVYMGSWLGNMSFVAAVLGGIGDIRGAMLGGFILGIAQIFATAINSTFGYAVGFIILIVILLVKPAGIMGKLTTEKV